MMKTILTVFFETQCTIEMSNLNESGNNFVHLTPGKLLKQSPNYIEEYYYLAELLVVEYRRQNISITKMALHK